MWTVVRRHVQDKYCVIFVDMITLFGAEISMYASNVGCKCANRSFSTASRVKTVPLWFDDESARAGPYLLL